MTGWVERYYGWLALILVAIVVGATCWPVIVYPQLDPDEYRYLALLQAAGDAAGSAGDAAAGWMERALVENRWDHLWWIADRDPVRFWRPTVLASFAVDRAIWGREGVEFGLCLSNVLIYTSMCLVFAAVLGRAFGRSWTSLVALGLFAAFFAHGEAIWYVSGRNETIAGFFALLAWWLHLRGGLWRYGGALAFLLALMTKELVIGLPLLLLVQEAWLRREELGESDGAGADAVAQRWSGLLRAAWPWLLAYGAAVLLWFALRAMALDGRSAGGASYPYFISPLGGGFVAHLWTQLRTYSENLLFATGTPPFAELGELEAYGLELWRTVVALGLAGGLLVWLRRERAAWFCALFVFVTWLPTSFVYVSERYLMLPSVGIAGLVAVALGRLRGAPLQLAGLLLVLLWAGHQGYMLQAKNAALMSQPRGPQALNRVLDRSGLELPESRRLLIVNFPGDWLHAQFFEQQLQVRFGAPELRVRILSHQWRGGRRGTGPTLLRDGERSLELRSNLALTQVPVMLRRFPWVPMRRGTRVERDRLGLAVEVLAGDGETASDARFELGEVFEGAEIWTYVPDRVRPLQSPLSGPVLEAGRFVLEQ
jgi:hypothetical protein